MTTVSIDVIVPIFRANMRNISAIVHLPIPKDTRVNYYLVVDRPAGLEKDFESVLGQQNSVRVIRNEKNLGVHISRNLGFEKGQGEYALFLDDDVDPDPGLLFAYKSAIDKFPQSPGFVGSGRFPQPFNSFTRGTVASDILTFWDIAEKRPRLAWGVTANLMVRRDAVGPIRFSSAFPKKGGGEDIDFCLRVSRRFSLPFVSVPGAVVVHPWWNNGSRQYRRFARWAYGDSQLARLHPLHKYRNAPNIVETIFLGSLVALPLLALGIVFPMKFGGWLALVFAAEFGVEAVRLRRSGKNPGLFAGLEASLVRLSNDIGRLAGNLRRRHILGFAERFDYFATRESLLHERWIASSKFVFFVLAGVFWVFA